MAAASAVRVEKAARGSAPGCRGLGKLSCRDRIGGQSEERVLVVVCALLRTPPGLQVLVNHCPEPRVALNATNMATGPTLYGETLCLEWAVPALRGRAASSRETVESDLQSIVAISRDSRLRGADLQCAHAHPQTIGR